MTSNADPRTDERTVALDGYLAQRAADGYRIETRSTWQAIIVRRRPLYFLLRIAGASRAQHRLVVSVDDNGVVTASDAEPLRW